MKAISLKQPWADLIVNGIKDIENRTWKTSYRGKLFIHASKSFDRKGYLWIKDKFQFVNLLYEDEYIRGHVIGISEIIDCVTYSDSRWFEGPYGFVLINSARLEKPFTYKGKLGIFNIDNYGYMLESTGMASKTV